MFLLSVLNFWSVILHSSTLITYIFSLILSTRDENDCSGQNDYLNGLYCVDLHCGWTERGTEKSISRSLYCLDLCGELILHFRYASLYFCCAVEDQENELITLEIIHRYVELLDKYFGSVSVKIFSVYVCFCFLTSRKIASLSNYSPS